MSIRELLFRRIILPLAVLATVLAATYFGTQFFLTNQYKNQLDRILAGLPPFIKVNYNYLQVSPLGKIVLTGLHVNPAGTDSILQIREIRVIFPNGLYLLRQADDWMSKPLPKYASIALQNLIIDLDHPTLAAVLPDLDGSPAGATEFPCRGIQPLSMAGQRLTGNDHERFSIVLTYQYQHDLAQLRTQVKLNQADLGELHFWTALKNVTVPPNFRTTSQPMLSTARLSYSLQPSYIQRFWQSCADQGNTAATTLITAMQSVDTDYFRTLFGIEADADLRRILTQWLTEGGTLDVKLNPPQDLTLARLNPANPQSWPIQSGLSLSYKDQIIASPTLRFVTGKDLKARRPNAAVDPQPPAWTERWDSLGERLSADMRARAAPPTDTTKTTPSVDSAPPESMRFQWSTVAVDQLSIHFGKNTRLTLTDGKQREGELAAVKTDAITLEQRLLGGVVSYHVHPDAVAVAEVLLKPSLAPSLPPPVRDDSSAKPSPQTNPATTAPEASSMTLTAPTPSVAPAQPSATPASNHLPAEQRQSEANAGIATDAETPSSPTAPATVAPQQGLNE